MPADREGKAKSKRHHKDLPVTREKIAGTAKPRRGVIDGTGERRRSNAALTRAAIFESAKRHFAEESYDSVRLDVIAKDAKANVALISRYFGSKQGLFAEVVKELMTPENLIHGDRSALGKTLADYIFLTEHNESTLGSIFLVLRSTTTPTALEILREINEEYFSKPFAQWLGGEDADLRAHLIQSTLLGTMQARQFHEGFEPSGEIAKIYARHVGKWLQKLIDGSWRFNQKHNRSQLFEPSDTDSLFHKTAGNESSCPPLDRKEPAGLAASQAEKPKSSTRNGRGDSNATRKALFEAAILEFTAASYEAVGLRAIALRAGADVALISRYFGSKQELFTRVAEHLLNPKYVIKGGRSSFGRRVAKAIFGGPSVDPGLMNIFLILRSAMSPIALPIVRRINTEYFVKPFAQWLGGNSPELRAQFIALAIYGSVQIRLLDKGNDISPLISKTSESYLAEWLQSLVDGESNIALPQ